MTKTHARCPQCGEKLVWRRCVWCAPIRQTAHYHWPTTGLWASAEWINVCGVCGSQGIVFVCPNRERADHQAVQAKTIAKGE